MTRDLVTCDLVTCDLRVVRGGRETLSGVSLALAPGEVVALVGPNGAGKTTLLRALLGLVRASGGEVLLDGRPIAAYSRREIARRVGYLPQALPHPVRLPVRRILDNAAWAAGAAGAAAETEKKIPARLLDRRACDLSGGERLRVYLAAARAANPTLLLLDEPLGDLDPPGRAWLLGEIRRAAKAGRGVLFVTHDLSDALAAADRAVGLSAGRVAFDKPAREVDAGDLEALYGLRGEAVETPHGRRWVFPS